MNEAPAERSMGTLAALLRGEPVGWQELGTNNESFLATCLDQDLIGLVHRALAGRRDSWPDAVISALADSARAAVALEMVRAREMRHVLEALATSGVRPFLVKGTALAHSVYADPALRPRNDTDLLVRRDEIEAVKRTLAELGYRATNYSGGEQLFRQFEMQRVDEFGETHALDIHWQISTQARFADLLVPEEVDGGAVPIPALGLHARTLGLPEALLLACVHPAMHHRNEERLIWVYDVHLLSGRLSTGEWDRFASLAVTKSVAAICHDALTRAMARFGADVPIPILARLHRSMGNEPSAEYLRSGRAWANELSSSLGALGWRDRLRLIREVAFPAPRYMLEAYRVSGWLAPALLPALYAHRGALGVWKVLTGRK